MIPARFRPKSRVRIALASQSAAKAGRAMLSPTAGLVKAKTASPKNVAVHSSPNKRILFITSECTPLAQTGGLGDMVAGLSKALRKRGHDVRIVMPLYQQHRPRETRHHLFALLLRPFRPRRGNLGRHF